MQKTLIFGHKKPDTDAVMSAIGLSYYKNQLGENTEPRVLGNINKETTYALNYFGIKNPKYLNDVKLQLKDINYHRGFFIKETESIYHGYQLMLKEELTGVPVIKENGTFVLDFITWRLMDETDQAYHVRADIDLTEMWIAKQEPLPMILEMRNNPLGIDWRMVSN